MNDNDRHIASGIALFIAGLLALLAAWAMSNAAASMGAAPTALAVFGVLALFGGAALVDGLR